MQFCRCRTDQLPDSRHENQRHRASRLTRLLRERRFQIRLVLARKNCPVSATFPNSTFQVGLSRAMPLPRIAAARCFAVRARRLNFRLTWRSFGDCGARNNSGIATKPWKKSGSTRPARASDFLNGLIHGAAAIFQVRRSSAECSHAVGAAAAIGAGRASSWSRFVRLTNSSMSSGSYAAWRRKSRL